MNKTKKKFWVVNSYEGSTFFKCENEPSLHPTKGELEGPFNTLGEAKAIAHDYHTKRKAHFEYNLFNIRTTKLEDVNDF